MICPVGFLENSILDMKQFQTVKIKYGTDYST